MSFIAIDIDKQSILASKYGDQVARNLSQAVGQRIKLELSSQEKYANSPIYHIEADRFFIMLKNVPFEEARSRAYLLKQALKGNYRLYSGTNPDMQPILSSNLMDVTDITVRIGVTSYSTTKLREILQRSLFDRAITNVRTLIMSSLNTVVSKVYENPVNWLGS